MSDPLPDNAAMRAALAHGRRGLGQCWPNPSVACLLVRDGRVVARARTGTGGRPHAETLALDAAGERARGATAYVTLEPCAHEGKTQPCAAALIRAGIARVVAAIEDPDPRVAGAGLRRLAEAGVEIRAGVQEEIARHDHLGHLVRMREGRPAVSLKLASSFDGRIATETGQSKWITGPDARRRVHALRARHDAVLIGRGTAQADDPNLLPRDVAVARPPVRIVIDTHLKISPSSQLCRTAGDGPVWICHGPRASSRKRSELEKCGVLPIAFPTAGNQIDLARLLGGLAARGLTRILCEGGAALGASLVRAGLADELIGFTAGLLLGARARPSLGELDSAELSAAERFQLLRSDVAGADVMHVWIRKRHLRA